MGKISIIQGIYFIGNNLALKRDGHIHPETREILSLPNKFKTLLFEKAVKFFLKYSDINITEFNFTLGTDIENSINAIAICHPFFNIFNEELGESIVIGRIKRMRGDLKYETNKPKRDVYGIVILDEEGFPITQHRIKFYKPYDLDEKILDKDGNETDKLKYPYIYKLVK